MFTESSTRDGAYLVLGAALVAGVALGVQYFTAEKPHGPSDGDDVLVRSAALVDGGRTVRIGEPVAFEVEFYNDNRSRGFTCDTQVFPSTFESSPLSLIHI